MKGVFPPMPPEANLDSIQSNSPSDLVVMDSLKCHQDNFGTNGRDIEAVGDAANSLRMTDCFSVMIIIGALPGTTIPL